MNSSFLINFLLFLVFSKISYTQMDPKCQLYFTISPLDFILRLF